MKNLIRFFVLLSITTAVEAQMPGIDYERILIPQIPVGNFAPFLSGRNGSRWAADLWLRNESSEEVSIFSFDFCNAFCPMQPSTPAGVSLRLSIGFHARDIPRGFILHVDRRFVDQVRLSLRIRELSREPNSMGTEIPVVRERDFYTSRLQIFPIPLDERFRDTLKIYDVEATRGGSLVQVRIFEIASEVHAPESFPFQRDRLIKETTVSLAEAEFRTRSRSRPNFGELSDLRTTFPELANVSRIRIEIEPVTPGLRFWAFYSAIHNETQQVSIFSPQ